MHRFRPSAFALVALLAGPLMGCGGSKPASAPTPATGETPTPEPRRLLSNLASQSVVVVPVQTLKGGDPMGWAARLPSREFLRGIDGEIAFVIRERGLDTLWRTPDELQADLRRNPTVSANLYQMGVEPLRATKLKVGDKVPEPLGGQLRALVALHEGRLALVPTEVSFVQEGTPAAGQKATGRAVLRLVLIDVRYAEIKWFGEVRSDPTTSPSKAVEATLALRLGDLVTAP